LKEPLWKNGSYARQVIYWGLFFLIQICRFRCKRCGRTVSCPYGWLVPYRRFGAEVVSAGVQAYASREVRYKDLSADLSDLDLADPELDIRSEDLYKKVVAEHAAKQPGTTGQPVCRPAHTTVFYWLDFACSHIEGLLAQMQKELVQEKKRGRDVAELPAESAIENPNGHKAATATKQSLLDRLTFAMQTTGLWLGDSKQLWYKFRAYFLTKAESCKDMLTDTHLELPITQSFELAIF
jgi:hypothetical protein